MAECIDYGVFFTDTIIINYRNPYALQAYFTLSGRRQWPLQRQFLLLFTVYLKFFARQITKSNKGDISVSLVLYSGNSTLNMKIKHRIPGNERPLNREFSAEKVLGHFACKYGGLPQVIHDIKDFGKEISQSPTQSKVSYRSIFIVPLKLNQQGVEVVKGFVSID